MVIGVCTVQVAMPGNTSLKDKRRTVKSLLDRAHRRFRVAAAEVDHLDRLDSASLAFVCVANETRHVDSVLNHLVDWLERQTFGQLSHVKLEHR